VVGDLTGEWSGRYAYSPPPAGCPEAVASQLEELSRRDPVAFTMSIHTSSLFSIRGTVNDAGPGSIPGECTLAGWKLGRNLRFTKTYPAPFSGLVDGVRKPLIEILRKQLGDDACEGVVLPPHRVHYRGTISADGTSMKGTWILRNATVRFPRLRKYLRLYLRTSGTWSAARPG
jgi:hypothetical protein